MYETKVLIDLYTSNISLWFKLLQILLYYFGYVTETRTLQYGFLWIIYDV